jgi:hypothetical protein
MVGIGSSSSAPSRAEMRTRCWTGLLVRSVLSPNALLAVVAVLPPHGAPANRAPLGVLVTPSFIPRIRRRELRRGLGALKIGRLRRTATPAANGFRLGGERPRLPDGRPQRGSLFPSARGGTGIPALYRAYGTRYPWIQREKAG